MYQLVKKQEQGAIFFFEGSNTEEAVAQGYVLKECWIDYFGKKHLVEEGFVENLAEVKAAHKVKINTWRDSAEQGGFTYLGKTFDSDPISCTRIMGASVSAQVAITAGQPMVIIWTAKDNSTIELSAEQVLGLAVALSGHSNSCHERAKELKAYVDSALTVAEVSDITWEYQPKIPVESGTDINSILGKE